MIEGQPQQIKTPIPRPMEFSGLVIEGQPQRQLGHPHRYR